MYTAVSHQCTVVSGQTYEADQQATEQFKQYLMMHKNYSAIILHGQSYIVELQEKIALFA